MHGYGVDRSRTAERYCPDAELLTADLENEPLPNPDIYFDVIYSKSVIEHFLLSRKIGSRNVSRALAGRIVNYHVLGLEFEYSNFF